MLHPVATMKARESTMSVAPKFRVVALATAVCVALAACGTSGKGSPATRDSGVAGGGSASTKDSGIAGGGGGGATGVVACGGFGRVAPCKACLQKNCCDSATACGKNDGCAQNAACIQACDGTSGAAGDACRQACADKYFVAAGTEYNGLFLCMSNSCKTECPFSGP
jgi:hypothetical protein